MQNKLVSAFIDAPLLENILLEAYRNKDINIIERIWGKIYQDILISSPIVPWTNNILYTMELGIEPNEQKFGPILETGYLDLIPRNAFYMKDQIFWFDQEWILENVPAKFILYRGLILFYTLHKDAEKALPLSTLFHNYDILICQQDFSNLEKLFSNVTLDWLHISEGNGFTGNPSGDTLNSIKRLLQP